MTLNRRGFLSVTAGASSALILGACATPPKTPKADTGPTPPSGLLKPGTTIPSTTLRAGFTPYADQLLPVIGIRRGYFKDVGITIEPKNGAKTDLIKSLTPLLNNQIELGSGYLPSVTPQLDTVKNVTAFAIADVFYGYRILAPKGKYKTVSALMRDGKSFKDACATVMRQIKGKKLILRNGVVPTFYDLAFKQAGLKVRDADVTYLENPDIVRAANAGRAQFVAPTGAVEIQILQQQGWEPLVEIRQLIDALPDETMSLRSTHSGYLTTKEYAAKNYPTLLRFTSVMYRLIDDLRKDAKGTVEDYRDYVTSYVGRDMSTDTLAGMFDSLYSLRDFEEAAQLYERTDDAFNYQATTKAHIAELEKNGVLKPGHTPADMSIAGKVYADLKRYRAEADKLLPKLSGALAKKAQAQYDARNYVDAYRLAAAAS